MIEVKEIEAQGCLREAGTEGGRASRKNRQDSSPATRDVRVRLPVSPASSTIKDSALTLLRAGWANQWATAAWHRLLRSSARILWTLHARQLDIWTARGG